MKMKSALSYSVQKALHAAGCRVGSCCSLMSRLSQRLPLRSISTKVSSSLESSGPTNDAALYVHWPYCARRCTYCNFNKYISKSVDHKRMARCLVQELETLLQISGINQINSIFFGGGTPSLAEPSTVAGIVDTVQSNVTFREGSEVTLEMNPTDLETGLLRDFQSAGVNRLSIGVQSLNEEDLKVLGRDHSVKEAIRCIEEGKKIFPGHVSVDVIFGRPGQTVAEWRQELHKILELCDNHVSLYQLTIERGTQLFKWVEKNVVTVPDNDTMADMYLSAVEILEANGLERYEVSNFAKKGFESQHNQAYWAGKQYIGIGPGAHGRFACCNSSGEWTREARIQTLEPDNWMYEVEKFGHGTRKVVRQSKKERLEELLCLGLRTRKGISHEKWSRLSENCDLITLFSSVKILSHSSVDPMIVLDDRGVRTTGAGLLVLDSLLPHILATFSDLYSLQMDSSEHLPHH